MKNSIENQIAALEVVTVSAIESIIIDSYGSNQQEVGELEVDMIEYVTRYINPTEGYRLVTKFLQSIVDKLEDGMSLSVTEEETVFDYTEIDLTYTDYGYVDLSKEIAIIKAFILDVNNNL